MLTNIRNRLTGTLGIVILAVIAVTFVLVGPTMSFTGQAYYARVNGLDVDPNEIERLYQNQAVRVREQFGTITPDIEARLRADAQQQVITQKVLESYLADNRIVASPDAVREQIVNDPSFQEDGAFSRDLYRQVLAGPGLPPERYEQQVARDIALRQVSEGIGGTSFVTPAELRRFIELTFEQRTAAYAVFPLADWQADTDPDDSRIQQFYEDNAARYQTEASAALSFVELSVDDLAANVTVTDEILDNYFATVSENYRTDPERNPRHILITVDGETDDAAASALAASLTERALAGEDFASLAGEYSKDGGSASRGGDLGWVRPGQFVGPVDEAVFAMGVNDIRGPIKSDFGYHVVRLDGVREGGIPSLDDVRADVEADYRNIEAERLFEERADQMDDVLFDNPSLETLAGDLGLSVQVADPFTRATGARFLNDAAVFDAVFGDAAVRDATLSEPIEYQAGRRVVLRVDRFSPPATRPLDNVRDDIVATLKRDDALAARDATLATLLGTARAGGSFTDLVSEAGGTDPSDATMRRDELGTYPGDLVRAVFNAAAPADGVSSFGRATGDGDDAIVFALQSIAPGNPSDLSTAERDGLRQQLAQRLGFADISSLVLALRDDAKVSFGSLATVDPDAGL
ncbi:MAG: SurA N-terminal domain-containing protein [Pseudomonadota bacterium]